MRKDRTLFKALHTTFSFLLLGVFVTNVIGYYFFFDAADLSIKHQHSGSAFTKSALAHAQTITLPVTAYDAAESEIRYRGKLYDVLKSETRADSVVLLVMNDTEEEQLIAGLNTHADNDMDAVTHNSSTRHPVKDTWKHDSPKQLTSRIVMVSHETGKVGVVCSMSSICSNSVAEPIAPPPKNQAL